MAAGCVSAEGELGQIHFPHQDGPGIFQTLHVSAVEVRDEVLQNIAGSSGANSFGVMRVLPSDWNAVQRTFVSPLLYLPFRSARGLHCFGGGHSNERPQLGV